MKKHSRSGAIFVAVAALCVAAWWILLEIVPHEAREERAASPPATAAAVAVAAREAHDAWNTYHGNAALTGAASSHLADRLRPAWRFMAGADVRNTPVACDDRVFFTNEDGVVFAVDLDGHQVWAQRIQAGVAEDGTPRQSVIDAPLACFGGALYVADADGMVIALDAATGNERWQHDIGAPVLGSPNWGPASKDAEYAALYIIAQDDGALYCLDAATGEAKWSAEGPSRCDGSPGVGAERVVFGSCDAALHVFSAATGQLERTIELGEDGQVASGVAIHDGAAISGCRSGKVVGVNLRSGEIAWSSQLTDYEIFTTPAVTSTWIVVGAQNGLVYGLDRAAGVQQWTFDTAGATPLSAAIADDKVVVSADGTLYLLALENGRRLWSQEVADLITSPAIVGRLVVVGCEDGTVAAFDGREP